MRRRTAIALTVVSFAIAPAAPGARAQTPPVTAPSAQTPAPGQPPPQTPPPATPATAPPAAPTPQMKPPALVFALPAGLIFTPILPAQTSVYEEVMGKVRESLEQSPDPVRKQQLAGWKMFRASEPYNERVLYVSVMDPAVPDATYNVFDLLQESLGDMPARELFEKFRAAHAGPQYVLNLAVPEAPEKPETADIAEKPVIKKN